MDKRFTHTFYLPQLGRTYLIDLEEVYKHSSEFNCEGKKSEIGSNDFNEALASHLFEDHIGEDSEAERELESMDDKDFVENFKLA